MKVPLIGQINPHEISIIRNGEIIKTPFPFAPFVYVKKELGQIMNPNLKYRDCTNLWTKQTVKLARLHFNSPEDAYTFYKINRQYKACYYESFMDEIIIENPDFFTK